MVRPLACAAIAAGADGLLVEVHCDPPAALSDGAHSLTPDEFAQLTTEVASVAAAVGRACRADRRTLAARSAAARTPGAQVQT
jgi:3-deoxy-D-manno-octulosonic acid (KDO) 8-phosphate synthase